MAKSYLNEWLLEFPKLSYLLSKEDRDLLSTIDPRQYTDFNITKETEVIRIINDHKPQAWKWERLFPELRNLSPEDHVILDHIVPNEYLAEVTESDVRRIIEYRKAELRKAKEESESFKAKQYYQDHKAEIEREESLRSRMTRTVKYTSLLGVSSIATGIAIKSVAYACAGAELIAIPIMVSVIALKRLDRKTAIPRSKKEVDSKMDFLSAAFIILYYIGFIGMGIALSTLLIWALAGWDTAEPMMITGLSTIGISVMLFLIIATVTPSKE